MATLRSSLIISLLDQVTSPARAISRSLLGLNNQVKGGFGARLGEAMDRNNAALDRARGRMVDVVAGFYLLRTALGAPLSAAASFETALEDIGQKAGIPTERLGALGAQIKQIAIDTNQAASSIAGAVDNLVGRGAGEDVALAAAGPIGKAATAYRASADDLAAASWAAVDNLKVPAAEIGTALDMMAQAGKEGAFELRDMAHYFPSLGAAYQGLGQSGTDAVADLAAALQIVRKGTGDASSAATNLQNVLQKVYSNRTITGFKKLGVDIRKEMAAAAEAGQTPIEAIAEITNRTLKGDLSRLGEVFEDAQVQGGMRALIQNMEEYRRIRAATLGASGVVDEDFARRIRTAQGAMDRWNATMENMNTALGTSIVPLLNQLLDLTIPIVSAFGDWAAQNPALAQSLVAAAAGVVAFKIAMTGLTFVGLLGRGGALSLLSIGFNTIGKAAMAASRNAKGMLAYQDALSTMAGAREMRGFERFVAALKGMALAVPGASAIGSAISAIGAGLATISLPLVIGVAAAVAAIGAAGVLVWKYWDRISSTFSGFAQRLGEEFAPAVEKVRPLLNFFAEIGDQISRTMAPALDKVKEFFGWIGSFFQQEVGTEAQKAGWSAAGYDMADAMINSVKTRIAEMIEWFRGLGKMILDAVGSIDLGAAIKNTFNLGGGPITEPVKGNGGHTLYPPGQAPGVSGKRAAGGPVWQGGSFLVGENQPEIFTPRTSGTITPLDKAAGRGSSSTVNNLGGVTININGARDPKAIAQAVADELNRIARGAHSDSEAWI